MRYWEMIVDEVSQREGIQHAFSFTNIKLYKEAVSAKAEKKASAAKKKPGKNKYYLGMNFPGIYFTQMELNTLVHLFCGSSTLETAKALSLSKRTIEYYIKNMKNKIKCRYTTELVTKVAQSDVIGLIRQEMSEAA